MTSRVACTLALATVTACCQLPPAPVAQAPQEALPTASAAPPLLGPADFYGSFTPRAANARDGGQSTYEGALVVTMLERALVAAVLPAGLKLATPKLPATQHPVLHLIGHQRDPHYLVNGVLLPVPLGVDYRELILLVPFVVADNGTLWHNFAVRMVLDNLPAVEIGNLHYAYAKEMASLDLASATATVVQRDELLFEQTLSADGAWQSSTNAESGLPRYTDLQQIFAMPIVGYDGRLVCSYFEWGYAQAEVAPATSLHRFARPFRAGMEGWVSSGMRSGAADGVVKLRRLQWRLKFPAIECHF